MRRGKRRSRTKKEANGCCCSAARRQELFFAASASRLRHVLLFPRRSAIRIRRARQLWVVGFQQRNQNRCEFASVFASDHSSKKRCRASGRKESKATTPATRRAQKRSVHFCCSAPRVPFVPGRQGASLKSDASRGQEARRGVEAKERERTAKGVSLADRPRAASRSTTDEGRKGKTSRWGRLQPSRKLFQINSQRPARDTVTPVREGVFMALVCIADEEVERGAWKLSKRGAGKRG